MTVVSAGGFPCDAAFSFDGADGNSAVKSIGTAYFDGAFCLGGACYFG